jgi:hypothetical protein
MSTGSATAAGSAAPHDLDAKIAKAETMRLAHTQPGLPDCGYVVCNRRDRCLPVLSQYIGGCSYADEDDYKEHVNAVDEVLKALQPAGAAPYVSVWDRWVLPSSVTPTGTTAYDSKFRKVILRKVGKVLSAMQCVLCGGFVGLGWNISTHWQPTFKWFNGNLHYKSRHADVVKEDHVSSSKDAARMASVLTGQFDLSNKGRQHEAHVAVSCYQTRMGLPDAVVQGEAFKEMAAALTNLRSGSYQSLSRQRAVLIKSARFSEFLDTVRCLLDRAHVHMVTGMTPAMILAAGRAAYRGTFITVGHDGYQSHSAKKEGVSIFWIDPITWKLFNVAISLSDCDMAMKGSSVNTAAEVVLALSRCGAKQFMLANSVQDTAAEAQKTGRVLLARQDVAQDKVTDIVLCDMHRASLVMKGALGMLNDKFEPGSALVHAIRVHNAWICDGRNKGRWYRYCKLNKDHNVIKFSAYSDTRILYVHTSLVELIRSYHALRKFFQEDEEAIGHKLCISPDQWVDIVEFESLLRPFANLSGSSQCTSAPTSGIATLRRMSVVYELEAPVMRVVDLRSPPWAPSTQITEILQNHFRMMTVDSENAVNMDEGGKGVTEFCMHASELHGRLVGQVERRLVATLSKSDLLGIMLNPIAMTTGKILVDMFSDNTWTIAKALLTAEYELEIAALLPDVNKTSAAKARPMRPAPRSAVSFSAVDDLFGASCSATASSTTLSPTATELDQYFNLEVDWEEEATRQGVVLDVAVGRHPFRISKFIDPLQWWKRMAPKFPVVSRLALRVLATPAANVYQESVFSHATHVNSIHRRSASPVTMEMNVLLKVNDRFVMENMASDSEFAKVLVDEAALAERFAVQLSEEQAAYAERRKRKLADAEDPKKARKVPKHAAAAAAAGKAPSKALGKAAAGKAPSKAPGKAPGKATAGKAAAGKVAVIDVDLSADDLSADDESADDESADDESADYAARIADDESADDESAEYAARIADDASADDESADYDF